jgi:hypothetical protein
MSETTQERSVPKPVFTDAEAGAKTFPDSTARTFNYYTPQKRKQSHNGITWHRAGCTGSPTAAGDTRWTGPRSRPGVLTDLSQSATPARAARATTGRPPAGTNSATRTRSGS